jgi:flagellar biosynthesis anti-sigma factor FlgM
MDHSDKPWKVKQSANDPDGASSQPSLGPTNEAEQSEPQDSGKQPSEGEALSPDLAATHNAGGDEPLDDVRRAKVEKIKKALADGTYVVSAEDLAGKLIEHMLEPKD